MVVKNITSRIKPEKTIMEIEQILARFGAKAILKEYSGERVTAISFFIIAPSGSKIPFKLPLKLEQMRAVIEKAVDERKLAHKFSNEPHRTDKALIVGWRIIKDWIHAQLSLAEVEFANPVEIFLSYAWNPVEEKTFYELIAEKKFKELSLEDKDAKEEN